MVIIVFCDECTTYINQKFPWADHSISTTFFFVSIGRFKTELGPRDELSLDFKKKISLKFIMSKHICLFHLVI